VYHESSYRILHSDLLSIITAALSHWRLAVSHLGGTFVVATLLHRGEGPTLIRDRACLARELIHNRPHPPTYLTRSYLYIQARSVLRLKGKLLVKVIVAVMS